MINVGVIGSGGIFRDLHLPYYAMSKKAKIVAVAEPTTSGRVGRAGIEIAQSAYLSSKVGKPVKISGKRASRRNGGRDQP